MLIKSSLLLTNLLLYQLQVQMPVMSPQLQIQEGLKEDKVVASESSLTRPFHNHRVHIDYHLQDQLLLLVQLQKT
jgi:hypothetical protein